MSPLESSSASVTRPSAVVRLEEPINPVLAETWSRRPGFIGWLTTTNHKDIGLRYIITAFVFFLLAGLLALAMRVQLAQPEGTFLGPDLYAQFFTTHGTT